ncbi:unnamed protein product [Cyprideis torosa]|uniref:Uncharacterized protein n=1 Tax=Cyprideis torosa TaxID=163714 RepID=A0A7R8ZU64_9CRUS|nr:unnamed protein product [Cyprideis torosa]CAG0899819.1 unnamed protein product [Cyprideis torosa]
MEGSVQEVTNVNSNLKATSSLTMSELLGEDLLPWPWAALLIFDENLDVRCGGTLIADGWILTAGHCVADPGGPTLLRIRLGDRVLKNDTEIEHRDYPIIKAIKHENYTKPLRNDNDIALIKFNNSECYPDHVYPVFLPTSFVGINLVGKTPYAVGWGTTEFQGPQSDILLQAQLTVEDTQDCIDAFGAFRGVNISSSKLCAYEDGRGTCQGDSGGGLYLRNPNTPAEEGVNYEIIGVSSFGYKCAEKDKPAIYTRVTEYLDWIEETIKNN